MPPTVAYLHHYRDGSKLGTIPPSQVDRMMGRYEEALVGEVTTKWEELREQCGLEEQH